MKTHLVKVTPVEPPSLDNYVQRMAQAIHEELDDKIKAITRKHENKVPTLTDLDRGPEPMEVGLLDRYRYPIPPNAKKV